MTLPLKTYRIMKKITKEQLEDVNEWLDSFELQRHSRKISREFSDGVLLAQILKQLYPKLVELHNYPPRNSTILKYNNWETLNRKILKKLGLQQSNEFLNRLAQAVPGTAEFLLYQIMLFSKEDQNRRISSCQRDEKEETGDVMTVNISKRVGDGLVQVPQKMILYSLYEKAQIEIAEKDQAIALLKQKVTHLDNFLKLKSQRIEDLVRQLASLSMNQNLEGENSTKCDRKSSPCLLY